jgi:hypothetical protein
LAGLDQSEQARLAKVHITANWPTAMPRGDHRVACGGSTINQTAATATIKKNAPCAHDLRQPLGITLIGLVDLHLQRSARVPRIKACDIQPTTPQLVHKPRSHRPGLKANAGIVASVAAYCRIDLLGRRNTNAPPDPVASWIDNADRRHLLRYVQTNKVSHDPPPMVETTRHQCPDRGTIDESARRRDYPMSTHGTKRKSAASRDGSAISHKADLRERRTDVAE